MHGVNRVAEKTYNCDPVRDSSQLDITIDYSSFVKVLDFAEERSKAATNHSSNKEGR
jgi:hypothetical protein